MSVSVFFELCWYCVRVLSVSSWYVLTLFWITNSIITHLATSSLPLCTHSSFKINQRLHNQNHCNISCSHTSHHVQTSNADTLSKHLNDNIHVLEIKGQSLKSSAISLALTLMTYESIFQTFILGLGVLFGCGWNFWYLNFVFFVR